VPLFAEIESAARPEVYFRRGEEKEFSVRGAVLDAAQKGKSYRLYAEFAGMILI
jgi:hypothetical protein